MIGVKFRLSKEILGGNEPDILYRISGEIGRRYTIDWDGRTQSEPEYQISDVEKMFRDGDWIRIPDFRDYLKLI